MLLALSVVMEMLVPLAFSKFHSESNCSTRSSVFAHQYMPFWHFSCGQNVALLLKVRCCEMSYQSDVRLGGDWRPNVSCVTNRDGRWQLRSDFWLLRQLTSLPLGYCSARLPGEQWLKSLIDDCLEFFCSSLLTTSANSTRCLFCMCCFRFAGVLLYVAIPDGFLIVQNVYQ